ncbi:hypothetical protein MRB53_039121 [Persea americana]|nr:hypothetical protein MRB53_039121 [Persea americana]
MNMIKVPSRFQSTQPNQRYSTNFSPPDGMETCFISSCQAVMREIKSVCCNNANDYSDFKDSGGTFIAFGGLAKPELPNIRKRFVLFIRQREHQLQHSERAEGHSRQRRRAALDNGECPLFKGNGRTPSKRLSSSKFIPLPRYKQAQRSTKTSATMSSTKIAIAGFTGRMSQLITDALLQNHPRVEIHGIARNVDKIDPKYRDSSRIRIFQSDATDLAALRKGLAGTSVCICAYLGDGRLMIDGQKLLIDACVAEGVERYIASDWSLDFSGLGYGDLPSKDPMKHVADYLDQQSGIKGVHLLNGAFTEVLYSAVIGYCDVKNKTFTYYGSGDYILDATTMKDAAAYTAEVAVDHSAVGYIHVAGDSKSAKDLAAIFAKVYGIQLSVQNAGSLENLRENMTVARRNNPQDMRKWIGSHYQYWMAQEKTRMVNIQNSRYPRVKPSSVEDFLRKHTVESAASAYFSA